MKIVHLVTLIDRDSAFGGPVSVAAGQCAELARRGHQVILHAGWDGMAAYSIPGVDVRFHRLRRALPTPGFSGLLAPSLIAALAHDAASADVVHIHLARDLTTLGAARRALVRAPRLVVQTHGMVMPDDRPLARLADALVVRRILRSADVVAALTATEVTGLNQVARGRISIELLPNGIDVSTDSQPRVPDDDEPTVLFLARLHPRKRVLAYAEMARLLVARDVRARFVIAGPDEGDLPALRSYLTANSLDDRVRYIGALVPHVARTALREAAVYVLPSEREPFPMTLLEAMAEGTPAVITDGCAIAGSLVDAGGPVVTDGSPAALAGAVERLLRDPAAARLSSERSRELARDRFSIRSVVDQLETLYRDRP